MRTAIGLIALVAVCIGLLLWARESDRPTRHNAEAPHRKIDSAPDGVADAPVGLELRDGVAHAPAWDKLTTEPDGVRLLVGGVVEGVSRTPVAGAQIVLLDSKDAALGQSESGPNGRFRMQLDAWSSPPTEPFRLLATAPDKTRGIRRLAAPGPGVRHVGMIEIEGLGALRGVVRATAGEPVPHATVTLRRYGRLELSTESIGRANANRFGEFAFTQMPRGNYAIYARDKTGRHFFVAPIVIPAPDLVEVSELPSSALEVVVVNTARERQHNALVRAVPRQPAAQQEPFSATFAVDPPTSSTRDGKATLVHVPHGTYDIVVDLDDGTPFEFEHEHHGAARRHLVVGSSSLMQLRLMTAPRPALPIPNTVVHLKVTSYGAGLGSPLKTTLKARSDERGIVRVRRTGSREMEFVIAAPKVARRGELKMKLDDVTDRPRPLSVGMHPHDPGSAAVSRPDSKAPVLRTARSVRVVTPDGTPVAGASVYVDAFSRRNTHRSGVAKLGEHAPHKRASLHRPDLASGDPVSEPFDANDRISIVWNSGVEVTVHVVDPGADLPIEHARIHPRPQAWRRVGPGSYRARWDARSTTTPYVIVRAEGYADAELTVPASDTAIDLRAELYDPPQTRATITLWISADNRGVANALVRASYSGPDDDKTVAESGALGSFVAITNPEGRLAVGGLYEGMWELRASHEQSSGVEKFRLMRGANDVAIDIKDDVHRHRIVDSDGKGISGARIRFVGSNRNRKLTFAPGQVADGDGWVQIDRRGTGIWHVTAAGYVPKVTWKRPKKIVLAASGAIDVPVLWHGGGGDPLPDGLRSTIQMHGRMQNHLGRRTRHGRVRDGRVEMDSVLPGPCSIVVHGLGAWSNPVSVKVVSGQTSRIPAIEIRRGTLATGTVFRDTKTVANALVFLSGPHTYAARTDKDGRFRFPGVAPGRYALLHPEQSEPSERRNYNHTVTGTGHVQFVIDLRLLKK